LKQIRAKVDKRVRVVLHGTNGFEPELMRKCIAEGCSKINVNKPVLDDYYERLNAHASKLSRTTSMEKGTDEVEALTIKWMEICGSAGKA
jgi:fructose-bisphosphate aldolase class II